tara:strand:- start:1545 stop:2042 length:498 start_codon:yes stop_codon:yes gene_type:complete
MEEKKIISNVFKNKSNANKKNNEIKPEEQYAIELQNINSMYLDDNLKINEPYKTLHKLISQKINSYIQQDIKKDRLDHYNKVSFDYVLEKIVESKLKCYYCKSQVVINYTENRQINQWTLDRINNYIGHNVDNVLISCLKCNLQRRRIKKDKFLFTKQLVLKKID